MFIKRKAIVALAALTASLTLLTACGSDNPQTPDTGSESSTTSPTTSSPDNDSLMTETGSALDKAFDSRFASLSDPDKMWIISKIQDKDYFKGYGSKALTMNDHRVPGTFPEEFGYIVSRFDQALNPDTIRKAPSFAEVAASSKTSTRFSDMPQETKDAMFGPWDESTGQTLAWPSFNTNKTAMPEDVLIPDEVALDMRAKMCDKSSATAATASLCPTIEPQLAAWKQVSEAWENMKSSGIESMPDADFQSWRYNCASKFPAISPEFDDEVSPPTKSLQDLGAACTIGYLWSQV